MTEFKEIQHFRQKTLWRLLTALTIATPVYYLYHQTPVDAAASAAIFGSVMLFFYKARLETKIDEEGVHLRFFPLHLKKRTIPFKEIEDLNSGKYHPVKEFGGWGIRWRPGKIAYNISGTKAVRITKENGKERVIGTQRPEELEEAIQDNMQRS